MVLRLVVAFTLPQGLQKVDTAVHEYAHLWSSALRAENKEEWKNIANLMKGTSVWEEIKETYPELKTDDKIANEVHATYSGRTGAERLHKEINNAMADGTASEKEAAVSALERIKQLLRGLGTLLQTSCISTIQVLSKWQTKW